LNARAHIDRKSIKSRQTRVGRQRAVSLTNFRNLEIATAILLIIEIQKPLLQENQRLLFVEYHQ
jgi:hypothetical protein